MEAIGFSTGALAKGDFRQGLVMLEREHADAVELSALRASELADLLSDVAQRLDELRDQFRYVSVHAPTDSRDEQSLVDQLERIATRGVSVVVHPDVMRDLTVWKRLGDMLCIENMDSRKKTGRTAAELRPFFQALPDAKLCFDVGHARQVDSTMCEARRILGEFGDRLGQVHMSEVNGRGQHFSMSLTTKRSFHALAKLLAGVPVILESPVDQDGVRPELTKAREVFAPENVAS